MIEGVSTIPWPRVDSALLRSIKEIKSRALNKSLQYTKVFSRVLNENPLHSVVGGGQCESITVHYISLHYDHQIFEGFKILKLN